MILNVQLNGNVVTRDSYPDDIILIFGITRSSYIGQISVSLHNTFDSLIAHKYSGNVCIRREHYPLLFMIGAGYV